MNPETAAIIDSIDVNLNATGMHILNVILAFVMFGVALGIKPSIFVDIFKNPKSAILGVLCQLVLLPALTFVLVIAMNDWISPMMALGMILVASCPGGNISNFMSSLSKANTELSVSLTAVSTSLAVFTTPANFSLWGTLYLKYANAHMTDIPNLTIPFWEVFNTIIILLGIPLLLGILCTRYFPAFSEKLKRPFQYLSVAFFVAMVVIAFSNNVDAFMKCIRYIFLVVLIHNLLALAIGYGVGTAFRVPYKDRRTLTIETGIQNSGLGLVLLFNPAIFDASWAANGGMVVITAWWGIWHIISGLAVSFMFQKCGNKK